MASFNRDLQVKFRDTAGPLVKCEPVVCGFAEKYSGVSEGFSFEGSVYMVEEGIRRLVWRVRIVSFTLRW